MDQFTETTSESWFGRLGNSFKQVVFGLILIVVSGVLLWWNEGRAVTTARSLAEGQSAVVNVAADKVDTANEGKLVHVSGEATSKGPVKDPDYGVTSPNPALMLERKVEMFQWAEEKKSETHTKVGGGTETKTTYTYKTEWSTTLNKSSDFKQPQGHDNPQTMPEGHTFVSDSATLGAFKLNETLLHQIKASQPVSPEAKNVEASPQGAAFRVVSGGLYKGTDPSQPKVGDIRITFTYVAPTTISVIAQQAGEAFQPYQTKSGDALQMLSMGTVSAQQMFKEAHDANNMLTWILRGVGWLLMTIGIGSLFSPLTTFASVLPFMGDILGFGVGLFAMVTGFGISAIIIALAWIAYRPLVAVGLLAAVVGVVFLAKRMAAGRQAA